MCACVHAHVYFVSYGAVRATVAVLRVLLYTLNTTLVVLMVQDSSGRTKRKYVCKHAAVVLTNEEQTLEVLTYTKYDMP